MKWACVTEGATKTLTVGDPFEIKCSGPSVELANSDALRIVRPDGDLYTLRLLEVKELTGASLQAIVTSYRPASVTNQNFLLTDSKVQVELEGLSFEVQSVIKDQKQEPYPSFPFWEVGFPLWFWLSMAAVFVGSLAAVFWLLERKLRERQLMTEVQALRTSRAPIDEYHKDLRAIDRRIEKEPQHIQILIAEYDRAFRTFLARQFGIPAHAWKTKKTLAVIAKNHRKLFKREGGRLAKCLNELDASAGAGFGPAELRQLIGFGSSLVEAIQVFEKQKQKGAV